VNSLLNRFDTFLIDLWGVLWDGREVYAEAVEFCRRLKQEGKAIFFLSNCAEYPADDLAARARSAGLGQADTSWMLTAGQALELWARNNGVNGKPVYVFGGEGVWENVRRSGALPIELPADPLELKTAAQSQFLILGGTDDFSWKRLEAVISAIHIAHLHVVLPNPDLIVATLDGRVTLPPGMKASIIETALPHVAIERLGKPYRFIYDYAFERIGPKADRSRALMIGDSLATDVRGANTAGIASLLLGQGVHMSQSLDSIRQLAVSREIYPDFFAQRLACDMEMLSLDWRQ
jgi:HAD superfamily hydrolase (TIGR01459 family)